MKTDNRDDLGCKEGKAKPKPKRNPKQDMVAHDFNQSRGITEGKRKRVLLDSTSIVSALTVKGFELTSSSCFVATVCSGCVLQLINS